jgi:hypothetical protein
VAEEASSHPTEQVTDGFVTSDVTDVEESEISDELGISAAVIVGGPPTIVTGIGISIQPTS